MQTCFQPQGGVDALPFYSLFFLTESVEALWDHKTTERSHQEAFLQVHGKQKEGQGKCGAAEWGRRPDDKGDGKGQDAFFTSVMPGKSSLQDTQTWGKTAARKFQPQKRSIRVRDQAGHTNPGMQRELVNVILRPLSNTFEGDGGDIYFPFVPWSGLLKKFISSNHHKMSRALNLQ